MTGGERCRVCDGLKGRGPGGWVGKIGAHDRCVPFQCPACRGKGETVATTKRVETCCAGGPATESPIGSFAGCGYCPRLVVTEEPATYKQCEVCKGVGRLEREPTPITKIVGWQP